MNEMTQDLDKLTEIKYMYNIRTSIVAITIAMLVISSYCITSLWSNKHRNMSSLAESTSTKLNKSAKTKTCVNGPNRGKLLDKLCVKMPNKGNKNKLFDIMSLQPIKFDKSFKNPCWIGDGKHGPFHDGVFHCLPYFYLIGVKKGGTGDFMFRMKHHPDYCRPMMKESQWLTKRRFGFRKNRLESITRKGYDYRSVEFYTAMFDRAVSCIEGTLESRENSKVEFHRITGEASPSNFHMHTKWEQWPGNEKLTEPRYTNFHYIKHLTPNVKIIILLRDPTTRLYSDFLHSTGHRYKGVQSPKIFHEDVLKLIRAYRKCFGHHTERSCVYSNHLKKQLERDGVHLYESFNAGFYHVFMKDMISVFGRDQILPIYMPDYITKRMETLQKVFSFLGMAEVSGGTMTEILNLAPKHSTEYPADMFNKTRDILYKFYRPFNEKMAALMNDSRYLFPRAKCTLSAGKGSLTKCKP